MSNLMDGLSNINSLTDQINALKDQKKAGTTAGTTPSQVDPEVALLELQKSFNEMLNSLMTDPSDDDEKKKQENDLFNNLIQTSPTGNPQGSLNISPYTGALNLDNIF